MNKQELLEALVQTTPVPELLHRLEAALRIPQSFDELEEELPPAARYAGPGVWIDAIKSSVPH